MKTKQYLQELSDWHLEISGFQKAASLIEQRLVALLQHLAVNHSKQAVVLRLLRQFTAAEQTLTALEKNIRQEKDGIYNLQLQKEPLTKIENQHAQTYLQVMEEEIHFPALKKEYNRLLDDLLG